jgi:glycerophosphoryl diester phosphodiesterase
MRFSYILIVLLLFSCGKEKDYNQIEVFGHAATGLNMQNSPFHSNSLEGVKYALSIEGCDGIEVDIQASYDGTLWLFHDAELKDETNGEGCISQKTDQELEKLHYSSFGKEQLIRLGDIDTLLLKNKTLFLDLRNYDFCTQSTLNVHDIIAQLNQLNFQHASSFKVNCILSNKSWITPFILAGYTTYYPVYEPGEYIGLINSYPLLAGFIAKNQEITNEEVLGIHATNKKVYIFEIRSPKGIRSAFKKKPDGLITDDIKATLIEKY